VKKLIFCVLCIVSFYIQAEACDANCVACHPKLLKNGKMDSNHAILNRCLKCHTEKDSDKDHGSCGQDCWSCHDIQKVSAINISEHRILPKCIKCHQSIDKSFFELPKNTHKNGLMIDSIKEEI